MEKLLGTGLLVLFAVLYPGICAAQSSKSNDMRRAVAFEKYKDLAAARQARKEAKSPSVTYSKTERAEPENAVKDPGEPAWRTRKNSDKKK